VITRRLIFHARYGGASVEIEIGSGSVLEGGLPRRALRLVREWETMHRDELMANWERARRTAPLRPIDPLS
jgi:Domain of unknown function (DUF4160)